MKISISVVFLFLIKIVLAIEKEQAIKECIGELSVDEGIGSHFKDNGEVPDETNKNAKCLFHCASKKMKLTDEQGDIDKDKIVGYISNKYPEIEKTKLEAVVLLCSERSEDDPCEKWYEFSKCQLKAFMEYKKNAAD